MQLFPTQAELRHIPRNIVENALQCLIDQSIQSSTWQGLGWVRRMLFRDPDESTLFLWQNQIPPLVSKVCVCCFSFSEVFPWASFGASLRNSNLIPIWLSNMALSAETATFITLIGRMEENWDPIQQQSFYHMLHCLTNPIITSWRSLQPSDCSSRILKEYDAHFFRSFPLFFIADTYRHSTHRTTSQLKLPMKYFEFNQWVQEKLRLIDWKWHWPLTSTMWGAMYFTDRQR